MNNSVRRMIFQDVPILVELFGKKEKSVEVFLAYFNEQMNGTGQVLVATIEDEVVGYITLMANPTEGPFANKQIPMISDLMILDKFKHQAIDTALVDEAENVVKDVSDEIAVMINVDINENILIARHYTHVETDDSIRYMSKQICKQI